MKLQNKRGRAGGRAIIISLFEKNENPINQGFIWNLFWYMSSREILRDMHFNLARSKFGGFAKYFWTLQNCVKIIILETCSMIIQTDSVVSSFICYH